MVQINISTDIEKLTRHLREIERKQIPFATATALNIVAKHAQATITAQLPTIFDRPTPFTQRAITIEAARKTTLTASVFVRPIQAGYLELEETGGTRMARSAGKTLPEPVSISVNSYGNIPRNKIAQLVGKPGYFIATVKGIYGLWQRPKVGQRRLGGHGTKGALNAAQGFQTGLKLIARFVPGWTIKPKFHFVDKVSADINKTLPEALRQALDKALG